MLQLSSVPVRPPCRGASAAPFLVLKLLSDLDGRSRAARQARQLVAEIISDLGGEPAITATQRTLCERAALLTVLAEDHESRWVAGEPMDHSSYATLVNAARRCYVGLQRRARDVSIDPLDYA